MAAKKPKQIVFAIVDKPGERPWRHMLLTAQRHRKIDPVTSVQIEPEQTDEIHPNAAGLYVLQTDSPFHKARIQVLERKMAELNSDAFSRIIGPFEADEERDLTAIQIACEAKELARPKTAEEKVAQFDTQNAEKDKLFAAEKSEYEGKIKALEAELKKKKKKEE